MSDNLDHKSNFITAIAVIIGGLSITDVITFVVGLVVLVMAAINNYVSIQKNRTALENEKRKKQFYENEKKSD